MRRHREIAALETAEYRQWIAEQQAQQEQNTMSIVHDYTDWTDTMTDRPTPTDRIKASGELVLYYNGTTTVMETLDHTDTRIVTVTENRSGGGYRIDTYLDGDQYSRGRNYSQYMHLAYTHDEALHLAIDILTA